MSFEKFTATGSGRSGTVEPQISLRKSGSIGINNAALEEFFNEDDAAVVMYYNEEDNRIGIEPTDDSDAEGAYTLSRSDSGGSITPTRFLRVHDLVPDITTRYAPESYEHDEETELVVIDLDDPVSTYGTPADEESEDEEAEAEADD